MVMLLIMEPAAAVDRVLLGLMEQQLLVEQVEPVHQMQFLV